MNPPLMYSSDWDDYREQTDTGTRTYYTDDAPDWLDLAAACPVCGLAVGEYHEAVMVIAASGDIVACLGWDENNDWQWLPPVYCCPLCGAPEGEECLPLVHAAPYCPTGGQHNGQPCTVPAHVGIEDYY